MSKLKTLAAAVGAMGAMGVAGQANAFVYALSHLEIQNLLIIPVNIENVTTPTFTFDLTNTANFGGSTVKDASCDNLGSNACGTVPVLDASVANAPGNTLIRNQNDYSFVGPNGAFSYATSDSIINAAQLVTGSPTATRQIAESELNVNGNARANSEIQSNTNLNWTIIVGNDGDLILQFEADPDLRVAINDIPGLYSAQANINASFTLTNAAGKQVRWTPDGTATNNCTSTIAGVTCNELADGASLNQNLSTGVNPNNLTSPNYNVASIFEFFKIEVLGLTAGEYSLSLNAVTSNNIRRVPEPGTIALLGVALAGIGFASRRKSKQA